MAYTVEFTGYSVTYCCEEQHCTGECEHWSNPKELTLEDVAEFTRWFWGPGAGSDPDA